MRTVHVDDRLRATVGVLLMLLLMIGIGSALSFVLRFV